MSRRSAVGLALFLAAFAVLQASPNSQVTDSFYSMLLSESLVRHGSFKLDRFLQPPLDPNRYPGLDADYGMNNFPYQLTREYGETGDLYFAYPSGSSLLSVPLVAVLCRLSGFSTITADGGYNQKAEINLQKVIAALVMAALVAVTFWFCGYFVGTGWALAVAAAMGLSTPVWSCASRGLWSETWSLFLTGLVVWELAWAEARQRAPRPLILASLVSWMFFTRPTYFVVSVVLGLWLLLHHRRTLVAYSAAGAAWLALYMSWSLRLYHSPLPVYPGSLGIRDRLGFDAFFTHLAIHLFSPARGLFIYIPAALFLVYLLARYRSRLPQPRLAWLAAAMTAAHLCIISGQSRKYGWSGVSCYGPRYLCGILPWLALLAALLIGAMLRAPRARVTDAVERGGAVLLIAFGAWIHGRAAISPKLMSMNWDCLRHPLLDQDFSLAWDWSCPQFLSGLVPDRWGLSPMPQLRPGERLEMSQPASAPFLAGGWGPLGENGRWTESRIADLVLGYGLYQKLNLEAMVTPLQLPDAAVRQRVSVDFDDDPLTSFEVTGSGPRLVTLTLPWSERPNHIVRFHLPDASSPWGDERKLGLRIAWFRLVPR